MTLGRNNTQHINTLLLCCVSSLYVDRLSVVMQNAFTMRVVAPRGSELYNFFTKVYVGSRLACLSLAGLSSLV
jgi:hypothetical protein